jgi:hypothetical protein
MVQMVSFQQKLAVVIDTTPNLYAQFRELIRLRAQVRKALASARKGNRGGDLAGKECASSLE